MNFYLFLSLLVVVCLGPWATARDVFFHLRKKNSLEQGTAEEAKRKAIDEGGFPFINGLVHVASKARNWTQWLRRLLKAFRKWCSSHPPEVKLAKCFANYLSITIPGPRRHGEIISNEET